MPSPLFPIRSLKIVYLFNSTMLSAPESRYLSQKLFDPSPSQQGSSFYSLR